MTEDESLMHRQTDIRHWNGVTEVTKRDSLVVEEPLEIRVNDVSVAVTMRTPGQDEALAVGFLTTEAILRSPADIYDVLRCADPDHPHVRNIINVYTSPDRVPEALGDTRQRYANSSCGLCGRATLEHATRRLPPLEPSPVISRRVIVPLPARLREAQTIFSRTGGLHGAGLFDLEGRLLFAAEDIGRHNAVDKVIGRAMLAERWPLHDTVLMVSGRAGFEIVQKALAARIPILCAVSAPSSLAVELARESGMTLVGFLRGDSMNVYSGTGHITG